VSTKRELPPLAPLTRAERRAAWAIFHCPKCEVTVVATRVDRLVIHCGRRAVPYRGETPVRPDRFGRILELAAEHGRTDARRRAAKRAAYQERAQSRPKTAKSPLRAAVSRG
jgi:hypothetical protein